MEQVVFSAAGGGVLSWTPDEDVILKAGYVESGGANVVVSTDPTQASGVSAGVQLNLILSSQGVFGSKVNGVPRVLDYPVRKGQTVFCATDAGAQVTLAFISAETDHVV